MRTQRNIFIAFLLNLIFSILEFFGGIGIGSVAIISDALHDLGDACSIGISFLLEKKSRQPPDHIYTYGYARYSVLGGAITTLILFLGSIIVILNALKRLLNPSEIHYDGMILFACIGTVVNLLAAYVTREKGSINQKAVNLHMLEDVLGWGVVLVGAIVMRFTNLAILDPLLSIVVAVYILIHAAHNLRNVICIFLEKMPEGLSVDIIRLDLLSIDGILDVHHIHIWTIDGMHHSASMHIRTEQDSHMIKGRVREALGKFQITHCTLELETACEHCHDSLCTPVDLPSHNHHHH